MAVSESPRSSAGTESAAGARHGEVRNTRQRRAVVGALAELDGFRSAQDLHRIIAEGGDKVSLATVYRILQSLEAQGDVDTVQGPDGQALYRRCADDRHHHHLLCRRCGRAEDVSAEVVEQWAAATARAFGYTAVAHTVEITGLCAECTRELGEDATA